MIEANLNKVFDKCLTTKIHSKEICILESFKIWPFGANIELDQISN